MEEPGNEDDEDCAQSQLPLPVGDRLVQKNDRLKLKPWKASVDHENLARKYQYQQDLESRGFRRMPSRHGRSCTMFVVTADDAASFSPAPSSPCAATAAIINAF